MRYRVGVVSEIFGGKMKYHVLSKRSRENLKGVKPEIVAVIYLALKLSEVDFAVIDGGRTLEEQRYNYQTGVSKTMDSMHLEQDDGFYHAVDLMPCGFKVFDDITNEAWAAVNESVRKACRELNYWLYNGFDMWGWDKPHWQDRK